MFKSGSVIFAAILAWAGTLECRASLLSPVGKPGKVLESKGVKVPVYPEVTPKGEKTGLKLTGAGLREKKVFVASVDVYFATSYWDGKGSLDKDCGTEIQKSSRRAIELTFLRDVTASQVQGAFKDSLEENDLKPDQGKLAEVLKKLDKDLPKGSKLTLVGVAPNAKDQTLIVQHPHGEFTTQGENLVTDFWKIWFGKPADSGLERLQAALCGKS